MEGAKEEFALYQ